MTETKRKSMKAWRIKNKVKRALYMKEYRIKNKEKFLEYSNEPHVMEYHREYSKKRYHQGSGKEYAKNWYKNNRERVKVQSDSYYTKNRETVLARQKTYRQCNGDKLRLRSKLWKQSPNGRLNSKKWNLIHRTKTNDLSTATIQLIYEDNIKHYGTLTCYLCLTPVPFKKDHLEHKTPLSRGGTNNYDNLAISCQYCNLAKNSKTETEYRSSLCQKR